jgi:N-acetylmuramic acid 6-phosphate etherase
MPTPDAFLDPRLTERRNPRTRDIDTAEPMDLVRLIQAEDALVAPAVEGARASIARGIELIEHAFRQGGRLLYVGAGTSGRLGVLDAAECPPTFGTPPDMVVGIIAGGRDALTRSIEGAEDDAVAGAAAIDEHLVGPRDVVMGIAASGTTPYVHGALTRARGRGAVTGLVTCTDPPEAVGALCDVTISVLVGPEVVTGSTRMKAGTATKLVLNTLTTGAMVRVGKTWGNLMVDLRAWNAKLEDRSLRIVMETTGLPREQSLAALRSADNEVKVAIVMVRRAVSRVEALNLLDQHAGRLRDITGDPPEVRG